jgi:hypothetical protein
VSLMLTVFGVLIIHCFSTTSRSVLLTHSHVSNSSIVAPPSLITSDDVIYLFGLQCSLNLSFMSFLKVDPTYTLSVFGLDILYMYPVLIIAANPVIILICECLRALEIAVYPIVGSCIPSLDRIDF